MKEKIIKSLSDLLTADNMEDRVNLEVKVSQLIGSARFNLERESELHTKNLIISTVKNYVYTSDSALRSALAEHLKVLETHLED